MSSAAYQQLCERSREVYLLRSEDGSYFVGKDVGMEDLARSQGEQEHSSTRLEPQRYKAASIGNF